MGLSCDGCWTVGLTRVVRTVVSMLVCVLLGVASVFNPFFNVRVISWLEDLDIP